MAKLKPKKTVNFWDIAKLNSDEFLLARNIEFAISNKLFFVILYIIDPDLVVYSICKQIRESNSKVPNLPPDDMLEDVIGDLVEKIFGQIWLSTKDLNRGMTEFKNLIVAKLSENHNQKVMNTFLNQKW